MVMNSSHGIVHPQTQITEKTHTHKLRIGKYFISLLGPSCISSIIKQSPSKKNTSKDDPWDPKVPGLVFNDHIAGWNIFHFLIGDTSTQSGSIFHSYVRLPEC